MDMHPSIHLPTITDEKLEDYLSIWDKLIDQDRNSLEVDLLAEFTVWNPTIHYTLTYGEEKRELTTQQACRVGEWYTRLKERIGEHAP